jgi:dihydroxy-acid dehydratase
LHIPARITDEDRKDIIRKACPGPGACGGMYTANTMATAIEVLGLSLPYSSSYPAESKQKIQECHDAGKAIRYLLENDIKPRDILVRKSFENAIAVTMALGGSTNSVLHLIAGAMKVRL